MKPALISLRIISIFNLLLSALLVILSLFAEQTALLLATGITVGAFAIFYQKIYEGLLAKKYWAWVAGLIVSGMHVLSLLFPLGIMGLVGLLNRETRQEFNRVADI